MGLAASRQEAFWEACGFGHVGRARKFLEQGDIDVNWVSYVNDCSPIHVASQGKPEIVQLLLEYKCDVNVKDNRGNLAIHHAAMAGHAEIVETLIEAGSEINTQEKNGWTALHNAAYWCHPRVVEMLIKKGCDVNLQNKDERTALHEVARSPSTSDDKLGLIAKMLIDAGSDINAKSSDRGEADLTGLMYAAYHNHPEVAQAFIDAGCELDAVGTTFWTALHWAADRENDELVYILVDAGANPLKKNMRGETTADKAKSDEIREVLLNAATMYRELHYTKQPLISRLPAPIVKPIEPYIPKCDAHFKSESFLPKDWKPSTNLQKLKELRERLREQHLKSLKNTSAIKIISHEIEEEPSKVKEPETKRRESSVDPDSRESSEDSNATSNESLEESDAIAIDSDVSTDTDSLSQLVSEATMLDVLGTKEKHEMDCTESNDSDGNQGPDHEKDTLDPERSGVGAQDTDNKVQESQVEVCYCVCDGEDQVNMLAEPEEFEMNNESADEIDKKDERHLDKAEVCHIVEEVTEKIELDEKLDPEKTDEVKDLSSRITKQGQPVGNNSTEKEPHES